MYTAQVASDLIGWSEGPAFTLGLAPTFEYGDGTVLYDSQAREFMRLEAEYVGP